MPFLISFLYWPIWLLLREVGLGYWAIVIAVLIVCALWSLDWKLTFGSWKFWK